MPEPANTIRIGSLAAFVAAALLAASPTRAQTIHGELVEKGTEAPVPGAFVVLLDAAGQQRDASLTDAEGRFVVVAPRPGDYVLGLDRIGYFSTRTPPIALSEGQVLRYRLETIVAPVALEDIEVAVESECRVRPEEGRAVARVWEEARKALNATAFTQQMGLLRYTVLARERELDPFTFRVREESVRRRTGVTHGSPYVALPPSVLARTGYARFDEEEQIYYGPDAATLLSDPFLDTHCFRLREPPSDVEDHLVGIGFEPVRDHRLPDIRGTLWVDERTAELERLEYRYTNLPPAIEERGAGGKIDFERLSSGEWIIREWSIRMPVIRIPDEGMYSHLTMDPNERVATVIRIKEDSGEVTEIVPARHPGGVRRVWAEPIDWRTGFARLEAAETEAAHAEALRASTAGGLCPPGSVSPGRSAVTGVVRDSVTGTALPGARVTVEWGEDVPGARTGRYTLSDASGRFVVCGVPTGEELAVIGTFPGRMGETTSTVAEGAERHALDLGLLGEDAIDAPRVRSTVVVLRDETGSGPILEGEVLDAATGEPLAGAQVGVVDLEVGSVTDRDGRFEIANVPPGRHRLNVEYLGYRTADAGLEVSSGARLRVEVRLVPSAIAVAALEVTIPSPEREERRGRGYAGWRLTSEEIPSTLSVSVAELLDRRFAGVTHARSRFTACPIIEVRSGRIALVVLDGQPFRDTCVLEHLLLEDIESIEVIPGLAGGVTYGRSGGAGVIVIETKHGDE